MMMMMRRFQRPSIRRTMRRNLYQHKNKISSTHSTSHTIDPITLPSSCVVLPTLRSYNYTSQMRRYSSFNYNNASIPNATHTYAPSYAQYQLQLKLFQSRWFSSNHRGRGTRGRVPRMSEMKSLEEALAATYDNLDRLSPHDVSAFWAVVPKLLRKNRFEKVQNIEQMNHQLEDILGHTLELVNTFSSRDLAQTALGLAKIIKNVSGADGKRLPRTGSPQRVLYDLIIGDDSSNKEFIFKVLAAPSMIILHKFDVRHLSNLIYAYGLAECVIKFEDDGSTLFDVFAKAAIPKLDEFNEQGLSNMLWSYANVKVQNSQLFEQAGDSIVVDNMNEFLPQALSNTLWAYATLDEQHPRLFEKIADHIVAMNNLNEFWPQALSNILWAHATLDEQHPQMFKKLADYIVTLPNLHNFKPQELKDIVWSFATVEEPHPQLFKKVADHIVTLDRLDKFNEQALSNILWAFATAKETHPRLFKKISDHIITLDGLDKFIPQHLSNILWAFATAGESQPQLFNKLADEAIKRQHEFIPQEISNFLWAYASNSYTDKNLFSSLVPSVKDNLDEYNAQGLINTAWAYAVANVDAPSVFNNEFITACLKKEDDFELEELRQLHQWQLWQEELKSDISLPSTFQKRCYEAFISRIPDPSRLQDDVVSILSSTGLQPREEVLMKSGYRIDAVVEVNGKQIAVEVDGPYHFVGKSREVTGSTILKHRQVAALDGMPVVSVPYWEWDKLEKDSEKKEQYLRHSLRL